MNLTREQLFNLVFIFVATAALGMILGLSVLRTVDTRLSDVSINIPEIRVPEQKIEVSLPKRFLENIEKNRPYPPINEYPSVVLPTTNENISSTFAKKQIEAKEQGGGDRFLKEARTLEHKYGALNDICDPKTVKTTVDDACEKKVGIGIPCSNKIYRRLDENIQQSNLAVDKCYRFDEEQEQELSDLLSDSSIQQKPCTYPNYTKPRPEALNHPDFQNNRKRVNDENYYLAGQQLQSNTVSEFVPRHPKKADHDPIAHLPRTGCAINNPRTHQFVKEGVTESIMKGKKSGEYFDRPWPESEGAMISGLLDQHYKDPAMMSERQKIKFMLTAKFDKMTPIDYRNWLLCYQESPQDLSEHNQIMLQRVLNGYQLTRNDLPLSRQTPKTAREYFERQVTV